MDRKSRRGFAESYSWEACTQQFLKPVKRNLTDLVAQPTPAEKGL